MASSPEISGPDPIHLEGREGQRYWVRDPFPFTGNAAVDEALAGFPVAVFQPPGRPPEQTPVVLALQGMAAPFQWNAFLIPALLDMGIACVLFDTPAAGERSVTRRANGDLLDELAGFVERRAPITPPLVLRLVEAVSRDCATVLRLAEERHGLRDAARRALFGVSLGALLAAHAFTRDGVGARLLGALGHADLRAFARSYSASVTPALATLSGDTVGRLAGWAAGPRSTAGLAFLGVLHALTRPASELQAADPMHFLDRVTRERRVRFLVGRDDPVVRPGDATSCARRFPDGEAYVVPGLGHGGDAFADHARFFVCTQLGDWRA
jgi:pimeloyl-ACP methyl ester carboxylesterase